MTLKTIFLIYSGVTLVLVCSVPLNAQTIEELKAGIVKIESGIDGKSRIGTGVIVRLKEDTVYIVTAAHVVEGDSNPSVTFYTNQDESFAATVKGIEGGDPNGLAALIVKGRTLPSGLKAVSLKPSEHITGGQAVTMIGFPTIAGVDWAVTGGLITGFSGPNIVFSGAADEGNSGGPLLIDGKVVGIVTRMIGQFGNATSAEAGQLALRGWGIRIRQQTKVEKTTSSPASIKKLEKDSDELSTLREQLAALRKEGQAKAAESARLEEDDRGFLASDILQAQIPEA